MCMDGVNMSLNIDNIELSILKMLQEDGRISYAEISKALNIPQSTVRFKVNKLIREGYIKKFIALLDPVKLGYPIIMIMLLRTDPKKFNDIFNQLSELKEIHHMFQITGKYDIIVIFHARDMGHVGELSNIVKGFDGVLDSEVLLATGRLLIRSELPL